jgi:transcriptional regulator with GAF, ATPase, and Fis domain
VRASTKTGAPLLALGEPCAAAIAHHRRLEELGALRNAAEADRETLLRRLGREGVADEIIGADAGLKAVLDRVNMVTRSDLPVLIFGETGAGKEVIARYVHERSPRKAHPFVRVNCGAIPPDLIDSELFGHERGAFTGAISERRGWFEQADSGTLFLDEIGDLPLPAQVRLLRVLQDGTLQRVGGQHAIRVDVRIVAATHRDLPSLIERNEFREDLWYRLASFPVFLPPLRERRDDIPQLAEHFVRRAARRFGLHAAALSPEHLALLGNYSWPGNVRELASVVDRAVIVGEGKELAFDIALGSPVRRVQTRNTGVSPAIEPAGEGIVDALDDVVRRHVESVLRRTRGVIEGPHGAAAILRVNPHTLRARLRRLKVRWSDFRRPTSS